MERVSRRSLLAASSGAAIVSAVIGSGVAAAQGTRPPGQPLTDWLERYVLVIDPAGSRFARQATAGAGAPLGPAYYIGSLYKDSDATGGALASGANAVGRFRSSGWIYGGGASPQMVGVGVFDIAGRGKITMTGWSGPVGVYAVSGGTGEFAGVAGEARMATLAPGNFTTLIVELSLLSDTSGR